MNRHNFLPILSFCITLCSIFSTSTALAQTQEKIGQLNSWQTVAIDASMRQHLELLSQTEQIEQWRDWIVLACVRQIVPSDGGATAFENLYDFPTLRQDALSVLGSWQYGEKRQLIFKNGEVYVFVPENSMRQVVYTARAADEYRLQKGQKPQRISVVSYRMSNDKAAFAISSIVSGTQAFSAEYGYSERTVANRNEITSFLAVTDDLVFAQKNPNGSLILGGRRFDNFRTAGVSLEDIAAIYQADNSLEAEFRQRVKRQLLADYEDMISKNVTSLVQAMREDGVSLENFKSIVYLKDKRQWYYQYDKSPLDIFKTPISQIVLEPKLKIAYSYNMYEDRYISEYKLDRDFNIGFSLDPDLQNKKFATDLRRMVNGDTTFMRQWFNRTMQPRLIESYLQESTLKTDKKDKNLISSKVVKIKEDKGETRDTIPIDIAETSLSSFINGTMTPIKSQTDGRETPKSDKDSIALLTDQILKKLLGVGLTKEDAESYAEVEFQVLKKAVKENQEVLRYIAQSIEADNSTPYFYLKAFLREELELEQLKGKVDDKILRLLKNDYALSLSDLSQFLGYFYQSNQYQKARYDGDFKGTGVGMTLFYTDLVMKLWSFNYKQSTPEKDVAGFIAQVNHPISLNYEQDMIDNPATRSWLGALESSYDASDDGQKLFFNHCATKIFNASSNDLRPGDEVDANYASERFATWWNNHYSEVADFEGEYHRLNQIMKWSQICHWLKIDKRFSFLDAEKVNRSLDFERWYPSSTQLKVQVPIPFINKNTLGEKTECLAILESVPFLAFQNAEALIYHMSGGVSLGAKSDIANRIAANVRIRTTLGAEAKNFLRTSFNLKNSKLLASGGEIKITKFNKTNINVSPRTRTATFTNSGTKLRGSGAEIRRNSKIVRRVEQNTSNDIIIRDETITAKPDIFKINRTSSNDIQLGVEPSDLTRTQTFVNKAGQGNSPTDFLSLPEVEQTFVIRNYGQKEQYLVKLKGNDSWLSISTSEKPAFASDLRFSTGSRGYFSQTKYQNVNFRTAAEARTEINRFRYRKISATYENNKMVELTNVLPEKVEKISIKGKNIADEVMVDLNKGIYMSNNKLSTEALSDFVQQNNKNITAVAENSGGANTQISLTRDAAGNTISIGNRLATPEEMAILGDVASSPTSNIRSVVIAKGDAPVKLIGDDILQVPKQMKTSDRELANFISERIGQNKDWANFFKNTEGGILTSNDISILRAIHPENVNFSNTFSQMKTQRLLVDEAVVDFRFSTNQPQLLVMDGKGIRIIPVKGNTMSDALQTIRSETTAKKIITLEPEKSEMSMAIRSKLEKPNGQGNDMLFIKDQPNIAQSMENSREDIYPDLLKTVFLSTVKLNDPTFPQIQVVQSAINTIGFSDTITSVSTTAFYENLLDENVKQLILVARATDNGLVFSNGLVSYNELDLWLADMTAPKDMIYIISNKADKIQNLIAKSGQSKITIASHFTIGKPESLASCIQNLSDFYNRTRYKANVKTGKWNDWVKEAPFLGDIAEKYAKEGMVQSGKKVEIPVGKFTADDIRQIPSKIWEKIVKATEPIGKMKMLAETRNIQNLIDDVQWQRLEKMRANPNTERVNIRAIPDLKVDITPRQKSDKC